MILRARIEPGRAEEKLMEAYDLLGDAGAPATHAWLFQNIGAMYLRRGDAGAAVTWLEQAQEIAQLAGTALNDGYARVARAEAYSVLGQSEKAERLARSGVDVFRSLLPESDVVVKGWDFYFSARFGPEQQRFAATERAHDTWASVGRYDLIRDHLEVW